MQDQQCKTGSMSEEETALRTQGELQLVGGDSPSHLLSLVALLITPSSGSEESCSSHPARLGVSTPGSSHHRLEARESSLSQSQHLAGEDLDACLLIRTKCA